MEGIDSCCRNLLGTSGRYATACHNLDATLADGYGLAYVVDAVESFIVASRCEYACTTYVNDVSDGLLIVGGHVYCSMKGGLHALGFLYELSCALNVYPTIGFEYAEYHPRGTSSAGMGNVTKHGLELFVGIEEVATAWTYHDAHIDARDVACTLYGCHGWGDAPFCG